MKSYLTIVLLLLGMCALVEAQDRTHDKNAAFRALGIQIHFDDTYGDSRIGEHFAVSGFSDFDLSSTLGIRARIQWGKTQRALSGPKFEYKGVTYTAQRPQMWNDVNLAAILRQQVSTLGSVGIGLGAHLIKVRRISYQDPAFWVDFIYDKVMLVETSMMEQAATMVRPSCAFTADLRWVLYRHIRFETEIEYKICFVGKEYGTTGFGTMNTIGISLGIIYDLQDM
jgi:hypothetical protein